MWSTGAISQLQWKCQANCTDIFVCLSVEMFYDAILFCFFSFNLSTSVPSVTRKKTSGYGLKVLILRNTGERHSQHAQRKLDKICKESTLTKCVQAQLRPVAVWGKWCTERKRTWFRLFRVKKKKKKKIIHGIILFKEPARKCIKLQDKNLGFQLIN